MIDTNYAGMRIRTTVELKRNVNPWTVETIPAGATGTIVDIHKVGPGIFNTTIKFDNGVQVSSLKNCTEPLY